MKVYSQNTREQELLALAIIIATWSIITLIVFLVLIGAIPSDIQN